MMSKLLRLTGGALGLMWWATAGFGEPLDDARKFLADKKYDEVDKALERELNEGKPRPEVLRVSLNAAVARGRFITADRRVAALLKLSQNKDMELLYLGAETADRIGDSQAALARFLAYIQLTEEKTDKTERALRYVLARGSYPNEYKKYVRLFGASDRTWVLGAALLDRLISIPEAEKGLDIATFLLEQFPGAGYVNYVHWRLRTGADNFELGREPKERFVLPLQVMLKGAPSDFQHLEQVFRNAHAAMTEQQRVDAIFALQQQVNAPLWGWFLDVFGSMRLLPADEAKVKAAKDFLALEPIYRDSPDPSAYLAYLRVIVDSPQLYNYWFFKSNTTLIPVAEIQQKFEALKAKYKETPAILEPYLQSISGTYLNADRTARIAFLRKHMDILTPALLNDLIALTNGENLEAVIDEYSKGHTLKDALDARVGLVGWYNKLAEKAILTEQAAKTAVGQIETKVKDLTPKAEKDPNAKTQLADAQQALQKAQADAAAAAQLVQAAAQKYGPAMLAIARDAMTVFPGTFNWQYLQTNVIGSSLIPADQKLALLQDVLQKGGVSGPLLALAAEMAKDAKGWGADAKFKEFALAVAAKPAGTDLVMRTHVAMSSSTRDAVVHEAGKKFLDEYKGAVPGGWEQAKNVQDLQVAALFAREFEYMYNNAGGMYAVAELWAPRLGLGTFWEAMSRRVREHQGGETLFKIAPAYVNLVKPGPAGSPRVWGELVNAANPRGNFTSVFADVYAKLGMDWSALYIFNQREAWRDNAPFFMAELDKASAANGGKFGNRSIVQQLIHHLYYQTSDKNKVSVKLNKALWDALLADEQKTGVYDVQTEAFVYGHLYRSGLAPEAAAFLQTYLDTVRKRTIIDQIDAVNSLYRQIGFTAEATAAQLQTGMRGYMVLKVLKPIYDQVPPPSWIRVTVHADPCGMVDSILRNWPDGPVKTEALATANLMVNMLMEGAPFEGPGNTLFSLLDTLAIRAVNEERWEDASRLITYYAGALSRTENWDDTYQNRVLPLVKLLEGKKAYEMIFTFIATVEKRNNPPDKVRTQLSVLKSQAGSQIPYLIPVDRGDATYDLFVAAQALSLGNEEKAWELTLPKLKLLTKEWMRLDPDYIAWSAEQMRKQKLFQDGLDFCMNLLLNEADLDTGVAAKICLTKGDIFRDMGNYQAARIEYEGLKNNNRYNKTPAGSRGIYRLVDLLILTKDYTTATGILERLVDSDNIETQAEAYYYFAKMSYQDGQYKEAKEYLKKVRERVVGQVEAAFLEGELNLRLPGGLQYTDVEVGNLRLAGIVIPGKVLNLRLQDQNLSVARGGSSIPVVITTSKGQDEEHVKLMPSATNKNLFVGQINTALGKIEKNNTRLEVRGDDIVSYMIEPEFQKANQISYPSKTLDVRADGKLAVSSGEILTDEEEEKRAMERQMRKTELPDDTKRFEQVRDNRTVRPGSPIYVQITDFDRDLADEPDKVTVDLKTTSGDILDNFDLLETGTHAGIFRGSVPTGIPLPKATSSDGADGKDPSSVISTVKNDTWTSVADGKKPKWVEVDTMSSNLVKSCALEVPDPAQIKQMKLVCMLADDYEQIAEYPAREVSAQGGMLLDFAPDQRGEHPDFIRRYLKLNTTSTTHIETTVLDRNNTPFKGRDGWMTARLRGTFWLPEPRALELKFLQDPSPSGWQHAYLFIDGQFVFGGMIDNQTIHISKKIDLIKGAHRFEILTREHWNRGKVNVGYRKDDGTFESIPAKWFSTKDNPALADYLKPKGKMALQGKVFTASLDTPARYRKFRWEFEDYAGNSFSVTKMTVTDTDGKPVVPVKEDFTAGTQNRTLEIAPGDQIQITYKDDKRLREDTPILEAMLNASFFNGTIMLANETIESRANSGRFYHYLPAKRCRAGDSLMIVLTDYDADTTNDRDTVEVLVKTSSGEKTTIKALESWPENPEDYRRNHSGVFMALLKIGNQTQGDMIKVVPGDLVTVSYVDRENTDPGIPVERPYSVNEAGSSKPDTLVYHTTVKMVEDNSEEAKIKLRKLRGKEAETTVVYKELTVARHPDYETPAAPGAAPAPAPATPAPAAGQEAQPGAKKPVPEMIVSVSAPVLFEVSYPKMALNFGSILKVEAVADSEVQAAAKENRKPTVLSVPMHIESIDRLADIKGYPVQLQSHIRRSAEEMLRDGCFAGCIRLQIGSPSDTIDDLVTRGEKQFAANTDRERDVEGYFYRVPTLLVSGSDYITIKVKDEQAGTYVETRIRLLSDARLDLMDANYSLDKEAVHLGEKFYVKVTDPDHDISNDRDKVTVTVNCSSGDALTMELTETLNHSGIFTGGIKPEFIGEKVNGQLPAVNKTDAVLSVNFGDEVTFEYTDNLCLSGEASTKVSAKGTLYRGSDGELACFTKQFKDPEMAVKTNFLMAEALFEMAKEHRKLKQTEVASNEISTGKRILEEAMRDYPNTTLASQGEFLLANLAQELDNYQEAIGRYSHVISTWPESEYAARSQFKKAICLEKMEHYDQACEEYVKVTYIYPESPLVADATVRLGNYYYKKEAYKVAGQIFYKFQQRNTAHALAPKALFLAAQCDYKMKDFPGAVRLFSQLVEEYVDQKDVREEAMYWLADSYFNARDHVKAYQTFKKLTWDYPEGRWAKIARGRLTEEVFANIEEKGQ